MTGLFPTGSISLGIVLVIGSILVPNHAATITAFIVHTYEIKDGIDRIGNRYPAPSIST